MAFVSEEFKKIVQAVVEGEELFDEEGALVEVNTHTWGGFGVPYGSISLGGKSHPKNRVPIEHYDEFKKKHPGSKVFFRGPRKSAYDPVNKKYNRTAKADATHFYIQDLKEGQNMALVSKNFEGAVKSVIADEFAGLTEEQLIAMAESFEDKLERIRAKIAKKPKDDYDFEPEKPRSAVTKVSGTYGKADTDLDDEGTERKAAVAATQVKRGRGRPRGSKNK